MSTTHKLKFCILILCIVSAKVVGQTGNITGKITGSNGEGLIGAIAELRLVKDSSLSKAAATDVNGAFVFESSKAGNYYIKASFIGYNVYKGEGFAYDGSSNKNIATIQLSESSIQLKSAEVTGIKPLVEVKSDMTVFNVENSINSTGSNAYELLQKAPGVVVDNNDNIALKGRGGVMVQIDGRPSRLSETELADYLKSVQSTDVEAIELISNPSSKYDAEGTAGIINIRLKKNKNYGTNGSMTAGYAYGVEPKYNTAISLNKRSRKFNVHTNYSNNFGKRYNEFFLYREQRPYIFDQSSLSTREFVSHNYKAGVDYTLNKKHSFGLLVNGNYNTSDVKQKNRNTISDFTSLQADSILRSNQTAEQSGNNINVNLNHHYVDTMGNDLTTDFDLGYFDSDRDNFIPNEYILPNVETPLSSTYFRSLMPTTITIYSIKSDYTKKFKRGKLGVGVKVAIVETDNTFNFYNIEGGLQTLDSSRSNHFVYTENVNAAYANYQYTLKSFEFQAGLRVENTQSEGDLKSEVSADDKNVKRDYTDFFPSAGITFNINPSNATSLVFSSRIDRPNYQELNPFENKLDELSFRKGNPFLNPQYSKKLELSHTYKYASTLSVGYSITEDFFAQIADTIPGGKSFLTPRNLATEEVLSISLSTSQQPTPWYGIYFNGSVINQAYDADFGEGRTINTSIVSINIYAQNTFKLPKGFTFELSGWYNSGGVWSGSYKTDPTASVDAGLQKKLLSDQATIKFSVTDIFFTAPWSSVNTYAGIISRANGNWESRQFRAAFTWRFGNKQMKNTRQRSTGSESEQKRVGGGD
jgi:iron complex outermembrane receptor protein